MSSGSEKRARNRHLTVRLTEAERAAIDEAAAGAGLMPGSYARQVLLGTPAPRAVRHKPLNGRELARILGALGHIGGNLNQLAKDRNSGATVYEGEIALAARALADMRDAVMTALGREP